MAAHLGAVGRRDGSRRPGPRVVAAGNYATPLVALDAVDAAIPTYRLFTLNAQAGVPVRDGVTHESPFVGPAVRTLPGGQPADAVHVR